MTDSQAWRLRRRNNWYVNAEEESQPNEPVRRPMAIDLRAFLRGAGESIVTFDPEGRVTGWNLAAERLLGWTEGATLGAPPPHLIPPERLPAPGRRPSRRRHLDGRLLEVLATVSPIRSSRGGLLGWSEILIPLAQDGTPLGPGEADLRHALASALGSGEIGVLYQPMFRLADRLTLGAEALLRWNRRGDGTLLPDSFIQLAEREGRIAEIGLFVLRSACEQITRWMKAGSRVVPVSVNVSAHQFRLPDFAYSFITVIGESGIDARWLRLEITESALIEDPVTTSARLEELRRMGVRVAIDDFGVGYSSLSRLRHYRIDTLKIDRSFVRDVATDAVAGEVVGAIIRLAHKLGMTVVAEGIETEAQLRTLLELGCDGGQGFLLGRAMPGDEIARLA